MTQGRFQTMRHIETVRNYLNACIRELLTRQELHDQSKLKAPESGAFEAATPALRKLRYGSPEYSAQLDALGPALAHHYEYNRHHPEHFAEGIGGMTLIDLLEMLCDWKASTLRHADGDIWRSLAINRDRFGYDAGIHALLGNTVAWLEQQSVPHHAEES